MSNLEQKLSDELIYSQHAHSQQRGHDRIGKCSQLTHSANRKLSELPGISFSPGNTATFLTIDNKL